MTKKQNRKRQLRRVLSFALRGAIIVAVVLGVLQIAWLLRPIKDDSPLPALQESPYSTEDFYWENGFLHCDATQTLMGIDVSSHQGDIDWQQVKNAGVNYVFVRLGNRGYGDGKLHADAYALKNLKEAKAAGIPVGAYLFSQAICVEEALEEAEFALELLEGISLDMPLVYDWEYISADARTGNMNPRTLTDCTLAFCRRVEEAGYEPMVYFNTTQARDLMYLEELTAYRFWFAMYDTTGEFPCKVDFWQYTDEGQIPGIEGYVDINMMFSA